MNAIQYFDWGGEKIEPIYPYFVSVINSCYKYKEYNVWSEREPVVGLNNLISGNKLIFKNYEGNAIGILTWTKYNKTRWEDWRPSIKLYKMRATRFQIVEDKSRMIVDITFENDFFYIQFKKEMINRINSGETFSFSFMVYDDDNNKKTKFKIILTPQI
jgi:hypothetical protein|nr:MAG TPA: hypothetical protein [Bacteriophage sp.]DAQ06425.1 MAG TPA: hypothetical protein [Bacteriophage sp.]